MGKLLFAFRRRVLPQPGGQVDEGLLEGPGGLGGIAGRNAQGFRCPLFLDLLHDPALFPHCLEDQVEREDNKQKPGKYQDGQKQ